MRKSSAGASGTSWTLDAGGRHRRERAAMRRYAHARVSLPTSAQYSLTIRVEIDHRPGMLGRVASAIGEAGGVIGAVDLISIEGDKTLRDITVDATDQTHWDAIVQ